jgi:hypothetical protein
MSDHENDQSDTRAADQQSSAAPEPVSAEVPPADQRSQRPALVTVWWARAALAGAGALLLLGGGLGGFAIGHATGGDGHRGHDVPGMGRPGFNGDGPHGPFRGDGRGQQGQPPTS